ncbi:MAG: hypothetical protein JNL11_05980 [Bdellovibrionaceae bacterium]|nr:hypothetical protein [Pseudobdellovibrionaceae bacterium]
MEIENNNVTYTHFTPDQKERQVCSDILTMINDLAPSDSFVEAHVNQESDGTYKARISVDAIFGHFKSESSDLSFSNSLKKAQRGLLENLVEWKSQRFLHS